MDQPATAAARYWHQREQFEIEAASLFATFGKLMADIDAPAPIRDMAADAARDELEHADRCRALVERLDAGRDLPPVPRVRTPTRLAPRGMTLTPRQAALYSAAAIGCVTETLSAALLLQIRQRAKDDLVADTAQSILRDETKHSQLGWAYLAHATRHEDTTWIGEHVGPMLDAALDEELHPAKPQLPEGALTGYGVLSPNLVRATCASVVRDVIEPGFSHFGITIAARPGGREFGAPPATPN